MIKSDDVRNAGIYIHGVPDGNDAGRVMLLNNIVGSYNYGLHLCDTGEYVVAVVSTTGYYNDPCNKNWEFDEENPVIATQYPYVDGQNYLDWFYLDPNSPFVNAGYKRRID